MLESTPEKQKITIREVAAAAGVTMTTVSSALHARGRVSEEQRLRIQKIARELGYQPKVAAQMLRARMTSQIGLILPMDANTQDGLDGHATPILLNFVRACESRGLRYHVEFFSPNQSFAPPVQVSGGMVDGLLVGGYVGKPLEEWLNASGCKWVSVDEPADYCVVSASDEGMYRAVERLAALGHRRLAYTGGPLHYHSQKSAYEGFLRAVRDFGMDLSGEGRVVHFDDVSRPGLLQKASEWAAEVLRQPAPPTAVLCHDLVHSRGIAYRVMKMGLSIPEDLSIIAVGPATVAERDLPCMSTIQVNFQSLVENAMSLLEGAMLGKKNLRKVVRVTPDLIMRQTVARPRQA
ncbi:MAG: LacI family DNA-binding transcriptional regulator [Verrucomicrobia bacterium]|nr:LacI family DNA-binding transcriptional regulator [Verrucomicrobiota bacterium]